MQIEDLNLALKPLPGAIPAWHARVDAAQLRAACQAVRTGGGRLVALWGADERDRGQGLALHVALAFGQGLAWLHVPVAENMPVFPDLSGIFPVANRMQRATYDLLGIHAERGADPRPWLRHGAWPNDEFPLRKDFEATARFQAVPDDYAFVPVAGDGVHEVAVGPVHAGIIEPGHFRFSLVGEKVLRLEERLGYVHKGIEKRFEALSLADGVRLAGRVSGDSTVAYAWAYAMAAESAAGVAPPPRALWLRALWLERERIANHLGDLGALGNDAAFAFGLAQFSRLREALLRLNLEHFGHRLLMDQIVPGGVVRDIRPDAAAAMRVEIDALRREVTVLRNIFEEHSGLQDRFIGAGRLAPELAGRLGVCGLVGRASGQAWDLRVEHPVAPYHQFDVNMATHRNGDVAARVTVRFDEVTESLRLIERILSDLPGGEIAIELGAAKQGAIGTGWVEGWRGDVLIALEAGKDNMIRRCHAHDPSWQNWPALEYAIIGNIVPDFPLINKSFNLSYSGQDL